MTRDMRAWQETKRLTMELIKSGGKSAGEIREALLDAGITDIPVWQTIQKWANRAGHPLPERSRWSAEIISFATEQLLAGATPQEVQLLISATFKRKPDFITIRAWLTPLQKHNPWKVAQILMRCRLGASSLKSLRRTRRRLVKHGAEHLVGRVTLTSGMDVWEIGQYLEECGENQAAIDTALLGDYTQMCFMASANLCLKKRRVKQQSAISEMPDPFTQLDMAA